MKKSPDLTHLKELAELVQVKIAAVASAAVAAITEVAEMKADKAEFVSVTLQPSGWKQNPNSAVNAAGYPYALDAPVQGVTEADGSESILDPASLTEATKCGLCPTSATISGHIRFYAVTQPTKAITLQVRIIKF